MVEPQVFGITIFLMKLCFPFLNVYFGGGPGYPAAVKADTVVLRRLGYQCVISTSMGDVGFMVWTTG